MHKETPHQKYKYEKLNKAFTMRKTSKGETVALDDSSDIESQSRSESYHSSNKTGKTSYNNDSDPTDDEEISTISSSSKDNIWLDGCRDAFIIDKLKTNSRLNLKEHKLSSNNSEK